jgi:hypothetical protein
VKSVLCYSIDRDASIDSDTHDYNRWIDTVGRDTSTPIIDDITPDTQVSIYMSMHLYVYVSM